MLIGSLSRDKYDSAAANSNNKKKARQEKKNNLSFYDTIYFIMFTQKRIVIVSKAWKANQRNHFLKHSVKYVILEKDDSLWL